MNKQFVAFSFSKLNFTVIISRETPMFGPRMLQNVSKKNYLFHVDEGLFAFSSVFMLLNEFWFK